jgi:hypothetical protein
MSALAASDACVLILPGDAGGHLELGYAAGAGKLTVVLAANSFGFAPEVMYAMCDVPIVTSLRKLTEILADDACARLASIAGAPVRKARTREVHREHRARV